MISQCSCCGRNFTITSDEVLFCSAKCKKEHDLFKIIEPRKINKKKSWTKERPARYDNNTLIIS